MKQFLIVFLGGGFGSGLRYLISKYLNTNINSLPHGTLLVNILGCFFIGIILGLASKNNTLNNNLILLLATGFCGGFTTFSTFAYENYQFIKTGDFSFFAVYTCISFILGLMAVFLGLYLALKA